MKNPDLPLVLMADDDEDDCILAKDAFAESGAPGVLGFVENGSELMSSLFRSAALPALILLDLNMPLKDGREVLKEIKSIPQFMNIPIVVLTTSREEKDVNYSREMGAHSFITKPSTFDGWVKIMRSLSAKWLTDKSS
ncbi:MAG: response regulator [Desulfobacterales bacterium]|nr:response regulator [Desulfobacterales bacterium]